MGNRAGLAAVAPSSGVRDCAANRARLAHTIRQALYQTRVWKAQVFSTRSVRSVAEADLCALAAKVKMSLERVTTFAAAAREALGTHYSAVQEALCSVDGDVGSSRCHIAHDSFDSLMSEIDAAEAAKTHALEIEAVQVDSALESFINIRSLTDARSLPDTPVAVLESILAQIESLFSEVLLQLPRAPKTPADIYFIAGDPPAQWSRDDTCTEVPPPIMGRVDNVMLQPQGYNIIDLSDMQDLRCFVESPIPQDVGIVRVCVCDMALGGECGAVRLSGAVYNVTLFCSVASIETVSMVSTELFLRTETVLLW